MVASGPASTVASGVIFKVKVSVTGEVQGPLPVPVKVKVTVPTSPTLGV